MCLHERVCASNILLAQQQNQPQLPADPSETDTWEVTCAAAGVQGKLRPSPSFSGFGVQGLGVQRSRGA